MDNPRNQRGVIERLILLERQVRNKNWVTSSDLSKAVNKEGFIDYSDATGNIVLLADTWTDLPNNGLGPSTHYESKPPSISEMLDVSTGYLDLTELTVGSEVAVRTTFNVTPDVNNSILEIRYLFAGGIFDFSVDFPRLDGGSGKTYERRDSIEFYVGAESVRTQPVMIQIKLSNTGILSNVGSYISLINLK